MCCACLAVYYPPNMVGKQVSKESVQVSKEPPKASQFEDDEMSLVRQYMETQAKEKESEEQRVEIM